MVKTDYIYDGRKVSYEVLENGYAIYLNNKKWILQDNGFFPNEVLNEDGTTNYEASCIANIEALIASEQQQEEEKSQIVTKEDLESVKLDILECLVDMAEGMM